MRDFRHADQSLLDRRFRMLQVKTAREFNVPASAVWEVVSDHTTWPTWHDDYLEHEAINDQTSGLGMMLRSREWWRLRSESEVTRWDNQRAVGLTVRRANIWWWLVRSAYNEIEIEEVVEDPSRCVVHFRLAFTGTILFWLMCPYSVPHAIFQSQWTARSSLKKLEDLAG